MSVSSGIDILYIGEPTSGASVWDEDSQIPVARVIHVPGLDAMIAHLQTHKKPALVDGLSLLFNLIGWQRRIEELASYSTRLTEKSGERTLVTAQALHDIRGMLTLLRFCAKALQKNFDDCQRTQGLVEQIVKSTGELNGLISDLLVFFQTEAGMLALNISEVRLIDELNSILGAYKLQAESKGLCLETRFVGSLPEKGMIDALALRRILGNLVGNAIKFTDTGRIEVTILYSSGYLELIVDDTGPGIPLEDRENIFKPYRQGGNQVASREGAGLGLYTSRQIAALMGGDVVLVKTGKGSGSSFRATVKMDSVLDQ